HFLLPLVAEREALARAGALESGERHEPFVGRLEVEALDLDLCLRAAHALLRRAHVEDQYLGLGIAGARQAEVQLAATPPDDHGVRRVVAIEIREQRRANVPADGRVGCAESAVRAGRLRRPR